MSIISDMLLPFVIRFGWEMVHLEEGTWPRGRAERTKHWLPQTLLHPRTVLDARGPDSGWGGQAVSRGGRPVRGPGHEAGCAASSQDTRLPLPQPGWARGLRARSLQPPGDAVNLVAHLQKTARFSAPISQGLVTKPWTWRAWLTHSIFTLWDAARSPNGRQDGTWERHRPPAPARARCAGWRRGPLRAPRAAPRCSHLSSCVPFFPYWSRVSWGTTEKNTLP